MGEWEEMISRRGCLSCLERSPSKCTSLIMSFRDLSTSGGMSSGLFIGKEGVGVVVWRLKAWQFFFRWMGLWDWF